jgi:FixJ family two-component response regulator
VSGAPPTVFVVDDDALVRRALVRLLQSAGYRTESYAAAEDLLARRRFEGLGCVVLDVRMPGLDGLDLQQLLPAADYHLPVIFITGHGDIPTTVRAMKAGAVDFLPKPFHDEELLRAVALALNKSQGEQRDRNEVSEIRRRLSTLTPREHEVLSHVVGGQLNKQTADDLGTAEQTIKVHRARVMKKMGASSLAELVTIAARVGIGGPVHRAPASPKGGFLSRNAAQ